MHLGSLDISTNFFHGQIPIEIGTKLSKLLYFNISRNSFNGSIPSSFGNMSFLLSLDLSNNNLAGGIPEHMAIGCFSLEKLVLSNNNLQDLSYNHFKGTIPSWIGKLSSLGYLILDNNHLEGELPTQLCNLIELRLLDLSQNSLYGKIPSCLDFTALHEENGNDTTITSPILDIHEGYNPLPTTFQSEESIQFTTKSISYSYKGRILASMSGIDLSCNKLFGDTPDQIENLTAIHALNLSHNNLTGSIPITFSNLKQIESLDLSYNDLNGKIPSNLVEIYTLSVFSVTHNNLSGKTPERINQFATFEEGSYLGNRFLCGQPLNKSCNPVESTSLTPRASTDNKEEGDSDFVDMDIFYITFVVTYIVVLLVIVGILIEFHPARKVFSGLSNGGENGDFKLETLNPSGSEQKKAGTGQGQGPSGGSGKKVDGSEFWDCGLDPELSFGMTFRRIFDLVLLKGNWYVTGSEIPGAGLENLGNTCFLKSALNV
ncbi:hypothetical protein Patl1_14658 [Pistacia atlantica]|uniref:Uncharacterized protein n=1 Tax=Pistacia atlantica TaxID=434234 RepID=A0ACC1AS83_9ROSI|nr:hypothetical protein Patl1_14658 [Pistacia atlantica]